MALSDYLPATRGQLAALKREFESFKQQTEDKERTLMAQIEDFNAVLTKIDAATNKIAADLKALQDQIKAMGLTADQEATLLAQLSAVADHLTLIGADPADPVPATA